MVGATLQGKKFRFRTMYLLSGSANVGIASFVSIVC